MLYLTKTVKAVLLLNISVFIISWIISGVGMNLDELALYPIESGKFEIPQIFTHMFFHYGFIHLFFNMMFLLSFGPEIEEYWSDRRFLSLYLISGIGAALVHLIFTTSMAPAIGASGAILGVMSCYTMIYPNRRVYFFGLIPVKTWWVFSFLILGDLVFMGANDGIAHFAHLGGALTGFFYWIFVRKVPV
jgi:membrane associated rhomboid family serine protease